MQNKATIHFITGKGGVGKSTIAASLTKKLCETSDGPVLLLEIQGSGRALKFLGQENLSYECQPLPLAPGGWGSRVLPFEAFKEYFSLRLALGDFSSSLALATAGLRDRLVDLVVDNKIVSAFVNACPGLEPAVLLGKIHWEAVHGKSPESKLAWKHVVVDAPSTGHGLMLFRSTAALADVFQVGPIFRQVGEIMEDMRRSELTKIHIVTLPEELPLKEAEDLHTALSKLKIETKTFIINRCPPLDQSYSTPLPPSISPEWKTEIEHQRESEADAKLLLSEFSQKFNVPIIHVGEVYVQKTEEGLEKIGADLMEVL